MVTWLYEFKIEVNQQSRFNGQFQKNMICSSRSYESFDECVNEMVKQIEDTEGSTGRWSIDRFCFNNTSDKKFYVKTVEVGDAKSGFYFSPSYEMELPESTEPVQFVMIPSAMYNTKRQARKAAREAAKKYGTGKWKVFKVTGPDFSERVKLEDFGDVFVAERIKELSEEFDVPVHVVKSLYDMMPNELYDGIVNALEEYKGNL